MGMHWVEAVRISNCGIAIRTNSFGDQIERHAPHGSSWIRYCRNTKGYSMPYEIKDRSKVEGYLDWEPIMVDKSQGDLTEWNAKKLKT